MESEKFIYRQKMVQNILKVEYNIEGNLLFVDL